MDLFGISINKLRIFKRFQTFLFKIFKCIIKFTDDLQKKQKKLGNILF